MEIIIAVIVVVIIIPMILNSIKQPQLDAIARLENKMEAMHELSAPILRANYEEYVDSCLKVGCDPEEYEEWKLSKEKLYSKYL